MSSDTTLVIARVGNQYRAAILQQAELFEDKSRQTRWDIAQDFVDGVYEGASFSDYAGVIAYGQQLEQECLKETGLHVEHGMLQIELDIPNRDVRKANLRPSAATD